MCQLWLPFDFAGGCRWLISCALLLLPPPSLANCCKIFLSTMNESSTITSDQRMFWFVFVPTLVDPAGFHGYKYSLRWLGPPQSSNLRLITRFRHLQDLQHIGGAARHERSAQPPKARGEAVPVQYLGARGGVLPWGRQLQWPRWFLMVGSDA